MLSFTVHVYVQNFPRILRPAILKNKSCSPLFFSKWHLLVQSQKWKQNVWNLFKVNNKDIRTTSHIDFPYCYRVSLLTLNKQIPFGSPYLSKNFIPSEKLTRHSMSVYMSVFFLIFLILKQSKSAIINVLKTDNPKLSSWILDPFCLVVRK